MTRKTVAELQARLSTGDSSDDDIPTGIVTDITDSFYHKDAVEAGTVLTDAGVTASAAELNYNDIATLGTGAVSKAVVLDASGDYTYPSTATIVHPSGATESHSSGSTLDVAGTFQIGGVTVTPSAAEINRLKDSTSVLTAGAGVSAAERNVSSVFQTGGIKITRIVVDLTGLVGSATDLDIIGNTGGAASAHFGQITAALTGTIIGGQVTCLEVPAGGATDIDFYSATVSTGAQDVDVTTLTETVLVTSGGAWTSGATKGMTTIPPANDYLYIVNGAASGGTFTAGKFLIELYGV